MHSYLTRYLFLLLLCGGLSVGGCDFGNSARNQARDRLENARERWQAQETQNYRFVYRQQRGEIIVDTAEVFVRGGRVDSIHTVPNVSEDELLVGTIESFFDLIEARIGEDDSQFGANFDDERGFPIDYNAGFQDDRRSQDIITVVVEAQSESAS
jgi:hypothetical protein